MYDVMFLWVYCYDEVLFRIVYVVCYGLVWMLVVLLFLWVCFLLGVSVFLCWCG